MQLRPHRRDPGAHVAVVTPLTGERCTRGRNTVRSSVKPRVLGGNREMEGTMGRTVRAMLACAVLAGCLAAAGPAFAKKTVCSSGCAFNSIQAAINAASEGATITIGMGTFTENIVVNKPVTLQGYGTQTVIEPATSNPVCEGGSLCGGTASNVILVEANNVTISKLKVEGDNP